MSHASGEIRGIHLIILNHFCGRLGLKKKQKTRISSLVEGKSSVSISNWDEENRKEGYHEQRTKINLGNI